VNQKKVEYTATRSVFTFDVAGKVEMEVAFLSPVYTADLVRQSQQMAYVSVKVRDLGGEGGHAVQVYMDVTGGEFSRHGEEEGEGERADVKQSLRVVMCPRRWSGIRGDMRICRFIGSGGPRRGSLGRRGRLRAGGLGISRRSMMRT
jgi:hypothetical protein